MYDDKLIQFFPSFNSFNTRFCIPHLSQALGLITHMPWELPVSTLGTKNH